MTKKPNIERIKSNQYLMAIEQLKQAFLNDSNEQTKVHSFIILGIHKGGCVYSFDPDVHQIDPRDLMNLKAVFDNNFMLTLMMVTALALQTPEEKTKIKEKAEEARKKMRSKETEHLGN